MYPGGRLLHGRYGPGGLHLRLFSLMVYPGMFDLVLSRKIYYSGKNTLLEIVASRYGENSGRIMSLLSAGGTVLSMDARY